ncbi:hypothetical protein EDB83DRAFT_2319207 [Lactarius deliciosus]|nr:hypothetical protein EDB83DRAFT_2319207 [Lactarius deliciosus]
MAIAATALSQTPTFSAFRSPDVHIMSTQAITHVAWSCEGKKLAQAAVGIDSMPKGLMDRVLRCTALKVSPVQIDYAPDSRSLLYASSDNQLLFMSYGKDSDDFTAPTQWSPMLMALSPMFTYTGDSMIFMHMSEHTIRIVNIPPCTACCACRGLR